MNSPDLLKQKDLKRSLRRVIAIYSRRYVYYLVMYLRSSFVFFLFHGLFPGVVYCKRNLHKHCEGVFTYVMLP